MGPNTAFGRGGGSAVGPRSLAFAPSTIGFPQVSGSQFPLAPHGSWASGCRSAEVGGYIGPQTMPDPAVWQVAKNWGGMAGVAPWGDLAQWASRLSAQIKGTASPTSTSSTGFTRPTSSTPILNGGSGGGLVLGGSIGTASRGGIPVGSGTGQAIPVGAGTSSGYAPTVDGTGGAPDGGSQSVPSDGSGMGVSSGSEGLIGGGYAPSWGAALASRPILTGAILLGLGYLGYRAYKRR